MTATDRAAHRYAITTIGGYLIFFIAGLFLGATVLSRVFA